MKLYHFNPNTYNMEYYVMANNKIEAHKSLLEHLKNKSKEDDWYRDILRIWKKVNPLDDATFPNLYTLDEYGVGDVIESELS